MNKIRTIGCIFILFLINACSSDEPDLGYNGNVDKEYVSRLLDGEISGDFMRMSELCYEKVDGSNEEWMQISIEGIIGGVASPMPGYLKIYNGKAWNLESPTLYTIQPCNVGDNTLDKYSMQYGSLGLMWEVYEWVAHCRLQLYVTESMTYDIKTNTLNIGNRKYEVGRIENNIMGVSYISNVMRGYEKYLHKHVCVYQMANNKSIDTDSEPVLAFESKKEVALWMIEKMRERFGDIFNSTDYPSYLSKYDPFIVNLVEMEDDIRDEKIQVMYDDQC